MPTLTIFAGINGAGKTTLYNNLIKNKKYNDFGLRINLDEILVKMKGDKNSLLDNAKACRLVIDKIFYCINNNISFNWETTNFSSRTLNIIESAKEHGFKINIHFIAVNNVNTAIDRVADRKRKGGHFVPTNMITGRHVHQFNLFDSVAKMVDNFYIYENQQKIELIGELKSGKFDLKKEIEWIKPYFANIEKSNDKF